MTKKLYMSAYLSVHLTSVYVYQYQSVILFVILSVCLSIYHQSVYLNVNLKGLFNFINKKPLLLSKMRLLNYLLVIFSYASIFRGFGMFYNFYNSEGKLVKVLFRNIIFELASIFNSMEVKV